MVLLSFLLIKCNKDFYVRIDPPHGSEGYHHKHIHIAKKGKKYSWNIDGSRHDKSKFDQSEKYIVAAKKIASKELGVDKSIFQLVTIVNSKEKYTLRQNDKNLIYKYYIKNDTIVIFLIGEMNLVIVELKKEL